MGALHQYCEAARLNPSYSESLLQQGFHSVRFEAWPEAIGACGSVLTADDTRRRTSAKTFTTWARWALGSNDVSEARHYYRGALALEQSNVDAKEELTSLDANTLIRPEFDYYTVEKGDTIRLVGKGFSTAISAAFAGVPARFEVVYDTLITITVPDGAVTGPVGVKTANGWITTSRPFEVVK